MWRLWNGKQTNKRTRTRRRLRAETLDKRQLLAVNIFHNEAIPEDVNEDGVVSSLDALTVINEMNRQSRGDELETLDEEGEQPPRIGRMTDVNNDGRDTALDALMVVNRLNRGRNDFGAPDQPDDPAVDEPAVDEPAVDDFFRRGQF